MKEDNNTLTFKELNRVISDLLNDKNGTIDGDIVKMLEEKITDRICELIEIPEELDKIIQKKSDTLNEIDKKISEAEEKLNKINERIDELDLMIAANRFTPIKTDDHVWRTGNGDLYNPEIKVL